MEEEIKIKRKQKSEAGAGLGELKETVNNLKGEITKMNKQVEGMES